MKYLGLILLLLLFSLSCFGQVITDQKEAERIYKTSIEEMNLSKKYYAEIEKCRKLIKEENFSLAEKSCRNAVSFAEKLPKNRYLEKHIAYRTLGVSLLQQKKYEEAIANFDKSLEIAKPNLDDTDSETGLIYYYLGQANHLLGNVAKAREFYTKAENTYRLAFKEIDDDYIAGHYPKVIKNILKAHLILLESANLKEEAKKIKERLMAFEKEFAKYLGN